MRSTSSTARSSSTTWPTPPYANRSEPTAAAACAHLAGVRAGMGGAGWGGMVRGGGGGQRRCRPRCPQRGAVPAAPAGAGGRGRLQAPTPRRGLVRRPTRTRSVPAAAAGSAAPPPPPAAAAARRRRRGASRARPGPAHRATGTLPPVTGKLKSTVSSSFCGWFMMEPRLAPRLGGACGLAGRGRPSSPRSARTSSEYSAASCCPLQEVLPDAVERARVAMAPTGALRPRGGLAGACGRRRAAPVKGRSVRVPSLAARAGSRPHGAWVACALGCRAANACGRRVACLEHCAWGGPAGDCAPRRRAGRRPCRRPAAAAGARGPLRGPAPSSPLAPSPPVPACLRVPNGSCRLHTPRSYVHMCQCLGAGE
jgi:hypothetical protein